ncbi:unnamed protein product [Calypogeia fissa]
MGSDPKAIGRMKRLLELQNMMLKKQQARDGMGLYPMRLLKEDMVRGRSSKERERGWINDYTGGTQIKKSFGYVDEQLALSRKILGREPDNPHPFISSLNNSKGTIPRENLKTQGRERGWTRNTYKEPTVNGSLYDLSKHLLYDKQNQPQNNAEFRILQNSNPENARKLEMGWVSSGRAQGKGRMGLAGTLGRPRGLTTSELQLLQKYKTVKRQTDLSTTGDDSERSASSHEYKSQRRKYHTPLVVPIGTLERSGFGTASYRASITPEGQRQTYNQLVESTGWVNRYDAAKSHWQVHSSESSKERNDADILKEGIEKEEEEGWMSSYRRKQKREMCRLAKQRDIMTATEVLKESYDRYREGGWINPLQRQKPGVYGLRSRERSAAEMMGSA